MRNPIVRVALLLAVMAAASRSAQAQPTARVLRIASTVLNDTRAVHVQLRALFELAVASTNYNLTGDARRFAMPAQIVANARELCGDLDGTRKAISAALDLSNRIARLDERQKTAVQVMLRRSLANHMP